jgi:hypothetical protein
MNENLFVPIELIEPLNIMADFDCVIQVTIKCNGPGYICMVGEKEC